ncbi:MAG: ROK family protein [Gammaproteobacteria bacterium]|nr:ROK family protein [Gammaproteobacteria bacterium]
MQIGIDLGGTKIEIIALDHHGQTLHRQRVPTPQGDYQAILRSITQLVEDAEAQLGLHATVGIGTPGSISPATGRLQNSNSTCLNDQPLLQDLQHCLQRPVQIANDANCFALSEAADGAAAGASNVFGVIIGTGTGAGIVINGKVLQGANGIAGEWGHNPLPWPREEELPGPACYCGKSGCLETYLSGPGLAKNHQRAYGESLTPAEMVLRASEGDQHCEASLRYFEDCLARGLAHVINVLDPEVIVLGGGLGNIERIYHNVPKIWSKYIFSNSIQTQLRRPMFGDSSGVRGAAWLGSRA